MFQKTYPILQHPQCRIRITRQLVTHTPILRAKDVSLGRQGKIMSKFIGERVKGSKKHWYPTREDSAKPGQNAIISASQFAKASGSSNRGVCGKNTIRRMTVLNKLFMKHITDLLATGEASDTLLGRGLQVSSVKITSDFELINVYWIGSGDPIADSRLDKELQRCSGQLRHDLSQLALMGEVPRIHFVRSKTYSNMAQVEALLRHIDFGPSENEFVEDDDQNTNRMQTFAASSVKQDLFGAPDAETMVKAGRAVNFPEIRHDVLGLNHSEIMMKILTKMRKSKQAWELHNQDLAATLTATAINTNATSATTTLERVQQKLVEASESEERFGKFLAKRRERKDTPERKKYHRADECADLAAHLAEDEMDALQLCEEEDFIHEDLESDQKS